MKTYAKIISPLEKIRENLKIFVSARQQEMNKLTNEIRARKTRILISEEEVRKSEHTINKLNDMIE